MVMTTAYLHHLNLSATPFRNRRLFWLGLAFAFGLLLLAAALTGQYAARLAADEQRYVALRNASRTMLEREQAHLAKVQAQAAAAGRQPTPEQARAMREALYLLEKRRLSWSRFLLQLEQHLPADIRITQIAFTNDAGANLASSEGVPAEKGSSSNSPLPALSDVPFTITVRAPRPEAVTAFLRTCDERGVFYFDPSTQVNPSDARTPDGKKEVEFTLRGRYRLGGRSAAPEIPTPLEVKR
ncbi:MAG: hypothetical protein NZ585_07185 [Chloracidobacterium sp.]|nr:hypothetical protein [Chloracidobacterium sp.]MDW8218474.1 hypothetical protein [Acidobacteriota bacterium]